MRAIIIFTLIFSLVLSGPIAYGFWAPRIGFNGTAFPFTFARGYYVANTVPPVTFITITGKITWTGISPVSSGSYPVSIPMPFPPTEILTYFMCTIGELSMLTASPPCAIDLPYYLAGDYNSSELRFMNINEYVEASAFGCGGTMQFSCDYTTPYPV